MKQHHLILIALGIVCAAGVTLGSAWGQDARRAEASLTTPLAKVRSYTVSCATTAGGTSLNDGEATSSMFIFVNSATPVYIGGTDIDSTHGMPVCTAAASCVSASMSLDVKTARCLSSSGTVSALVIAGAQ